MVVNLACELIKDVYFLLLTQKNVKRITKCCLNKVINNKRMCNFVLNMDVDLLIFAAPLAIPTLSLCRSRLDCCTKHAGPVQPPQATAHCPYSMTSCSLKRGKTNSNSVLVFFLAETCRKLLSLLQFRTQYSTPFRKKL